LADGDPGAVPLGVLEAGRVGARRGRDEHQQQQRPHSFSIASRHWPESWSFWLLRQPHTAPPPCGTIWQSLPLSPQQAAVKSFFISRQLLNASWHCEESWYSFCLRQAATRPSPGWTLLQNCFASPLQSAAIFFTLSRIGFRSPLHTCDSSWSCVRRQPS